MAVYSDIVRTGAIILFVLAGITNNIPMAIMGLGMILISIFEEWKQEQTK